MRHFTFYDLYYKLIKNADDEVAGRFARNVCKVMFTDEHVVVPTDNTEAFIWSNVEDILYKTKEVESVGKTPKVFNKKMQHFCFWDTFYKAIQLMNDEDCGIYIKALCSYMLDNIQPKKLKPPVDMYFELAKLKLELSKVRIASGKKGGTAKRIPLTVEQVESAKDKHCWLTFDEFMRRHANIKNDLYKNSQHLTNGVDWQVVELGIERSDKYRNCQSLFVLLTHYEELKQAAFA